KTHHGHHIQRADDGTWHWLTPTRHSYPIHPTILDTLRLLDHNQTEPDPPGRQDPPQNPEPPPY
ncbi:MAG: hypothetical protein ACOCT8_05355, partial [Actinomycetota bacterium]